MRAAASRDRAFELASVVAFAQNPNDAMAQASQLLGDGACRAAKMSDALSQNISTPPAPTRKPTIGLSARRPLPWTISPSLLPTLFRAAQTARCSSVFTAAMAALNSCAQPLPLRPEVRLT